jgi:hypothetical protein
LRRRLGRFLLDLALHCRFPQTVFGRLEPIFGRPFDQIRKAGARRYDAGLAQIFVQHIDAALRISLPVFASKPLDSIVSDELADAHQIGAENLSLRTDSPRADAEIDTTGRSIEESLAMLVETIKAASAA